jgi:hypothetical protein
MARLLQPLQVTSPYCTSLWRPAETTAYSDGSDVGVSVTCCFYIKIKCGLTLPSVCNSFLKRHKDSTAGVQGDPLCAGRFWSSATQPTRSNDGMAPLSLPETFLSPSLSLNHFPNVHLTQTRAASVIAPHHLFRFVWPSSYGWTGNGRLSTSQPGQSR